ncbi:MAG: histidyl-tRNA synthetase, partial [Thermoleophilaceae bacterium]|nr:histidyl-tRNA synthetase [Thermoleophilaceae bacterium]
MAEKINAPRGTSDVLPEDGRARLRLVGLAAETFGRAGYGPIETPIFEATELFERGVGETTDVVEKEMFTFDDQGGRSMTLRPEGTAPVCRAYVEHGMHKLPQPVKLWYAGPFFRYEAPQAGRYRQFTQIGLEAIGSDAPSLDAEAILLLAELLERAGARGVRFRVSSLGTAETRRAYSDELREHLRARED